MLLEKYTVIRDLPKDIYTFISEGPKGPVRKVIRYDPLGGNFFNLGFGDWNNEQHGIDDVIRTNNNDKEKVLATVASTVVDFLERKPNVQIFVQGSTASRTRLYQMGIRSNWNEIRKLVVVYGITEGEAEPFRMGKNYDAFVVQAKRVY